MKYLLSIATVLLLLGCSGQETESTAKEASEVTEKAKTVASTTTEKTETVSEEIKEEAQAVVENVEAEASGLQKTIAPQLPEQAKTAAADGAALYKKCVSCHGAHAEKSALNKSKIIAGWDVAQTEAALKGYQDGNYGGAMKTLMQGQVKTLSDAEIKALSEFINKQ